jgi:hypothetical protein
VRCHSHQRAALIRAVVTGARDGVKFDPTCGGAPQGRDWEMDGVDPIHQPAEDHYLASLSAEQSRAAQPAAPKKCSFPAS